MKALILAAGYATRLFPLTKDTPKSLLKLNGRLVIDYILDKIEQIGDINEILIVSNNKFYGQFNRWLVVKAENKLNKYILLNDGSNAVKDRLGAIRDLNFAIENELIDDDLLILAGDNLFDFNLNDFVRFGFDKKPYHSVCLYLPNNNYADLTRFGIAQLNEFTQVVNFEEKPAMPRSNLIGTCIYFIPKEKLYLVPEYLNSGNNSDTPGSYINWLVRKDKVFGKIYDGTWLDLGDFDSLSQAVIYLNGNKLIPVSHE